MRRPIQGVCLEWLIRIGTSFMHSPRGCATILQRTAVLESTSLEVRHYLGEQ